FKNYPHSFYKDVHNACVCAIKLNRQKEAFEFARMLVLYGYELTDFDKEPFEYLKSKEKLWEKFVSEYLNLRKKYLQTIDEEQRKCYHNIFVVDQSVAHPKTDKEYRQSDSVFYDLSIKLSELVKNNGFPNWIINKDTMSIKLVVMLSHYCGLENRIKEDPNLQNDCLYVSMLDNRIHAIVDHAFNAGLMLPDTYVGVSTYLMNKNLYGKISFQFDWDKEKVIPVLNLTPEEVIQVNNNRKSIGLPPINSDTESMIINTTWFKRFPFKKIKKAMAECKNCTSDEIRKITMEFAFEVKEKYQKENSHFILHTIGE
ncbi:MAG: hypothetical protein LBV47_05655, partial [Bacteroidales bacterium]|nr:hypothetical protein [Bacteroidales bacterium]